MTKIYIMLKKNIRIGFFVANKKSNIFHLQKKNSAIELQQKKTLNNDKLNFLIPKENYIFSPINNLRRKKFCFSYLIMSNNKSIHKKK